jgi:hypothetical protein
MYGSISAVAFYTVVSLVQFAGTKELREVATLFGTALKIKIFYVYFRHLHLSLRVVLDLCAQVSFVTCNASYLYPCSILLTRATLHIHIEPKYIVVFCGTSLSGLVHATHEIVSIRVLLYFSKVVRERREYQVTLICAQTGPVDHLQHGVIEFEAPLSSQNKRAPDAPIRPCFLNGRIIITLVIASKSLFYTKDQLTQMVRFFRSDHPESRHCIVLEVVFRMEL